MIQHLLSKHCAFSIHWDNWGEYLQLQQVFSVPANLDGHFNWVGTRGLYRDRTVACGAEHNQR